MASTSVLKVLRSQLREARAVSLSSNTVACLPGFGVTRVRSPSFGYPALLAVQLELIVWEAGPHGVDELLAVYFPSDLERVFVGVDV